MRNLLVLMTLAICLLFGCSQNDNEVNYFTSDLDTLVIKSDKLKGHGLFRVGAGELWVMDSTECNSYEWWQFPEVIPNNITDIKFGVILVNLKPIRYYSPEGEELVQKDSAMGNNIISLISGQMDGDTVVVVDQNHNWDLSDDSVRTINYFDMKGLTNLIQCNYSVDIGSMEIPDSGWVQIGRSKWFGMVLQNTPQRMEADLQIDELDFRIGVVDYNSYSFCFFRPQLALLSENGIARDTLMKRDLVELGEFVKLGDYYYKFHDFYSGDGTIILLKETDYQSMIGIQVGLNAPSFSFKSIHGDTVKSESFKDKKILITNMSWCTARSYDKYKEIVDECDGKLTIIGFGSSVREDLGGIMLDAEESFNDDMYSKYRNAYSSYSCYLIGEEGKIIDMFDIFEWESHLSDY